jgi:hypothetical protein
MRNFKQEALIKAMKEKRLEQKKVKDYFDSDMGKSLLDKVHKLRDVDIDPKTLPF